MGFEHGPPAVVPEGARGPIPTKAPGGGRADAVNLRTREVVELKPNNPAAIRSGQRQADAYARELERTYPGAPFRARVQTYDRP